MPKLGKELADLVRELRGARLTKEEAAELRGAEEMARVGMAKEALGSLRTLRETVRAGGRIGRGPVAEAAEAEAAAKLPEVKEAAEAREADVAAGEAAEKELAAVEQAAVRQPWYAPLKRATDQVVKEHPVLAGFPLWLMRLGWKFKGTYLKFAGLSMFASFIFEEALQAFAFSLSFGIREDRKRMGDPGLSTEAEYKALKTDYEGTIALFDLAVKGMDWWVSTLGQSALWFITPYEHYVAAAQRQVASARHQLEEIEDERRHLTGTAAAQRSKDAYYTVDRAFDPLTGLSMRISEALKSTPQKDPDVGGARDALADLKSAIENARATLDDMRADLKEVRDPETGVVRNKGIIRSFESSLFGFESSVRSFQRQIDKILEGTAPTPSTPTTSDIEARLRAAEAAEGR